MNPYHTLEKRLRRTLWHLIILTFSSRFLIVCLAGLFLCSLWQFLRLNEPALALPSPLATLLIATASSLIAALLTRRKMNGLQAAIRQAERQFPRLGLKLTTSAQAARSPEMTSEDIRAALWEDTLSTSGSTPWKHIERPFLAGLLALATVVLWLLPAGMLVQSLVLHLTPHAGAAMDGSQETPPASVDASLAIADPGKDLWATKIELIPLELLARSPHGFRNAALIASVNGTEPLRLPIDAHLPPGDAPFEAELFLDELGVKDYDTISYSIEAEALATESSSGPAQLKTSPIYFVQIRPLNEEVLEPRIGNGLDADIVAALVDLKKLLTWLIEEERIVIRASWLAQSLQHDPAKQKIHDEGAAFAQDSQRVILENLSKANEVFSTSLQEVLPADFFVAFRQVEKSMESALSELLAVRWQPAIRHEQKALSELVSLWALFTKLLLPLGETPCEGDPALRGLEDRQEFRRKKADLAALAEEQEQLSEQVEKWGDHEEGTFPDIPWKDYNQQSQDLAKVQADLLDRLTNLQDKPSTEQTSASPSRSPTDTAESSPADPSQDAMEAACQAMQHTLDALGKGSADEAAPAAAAAAARLREAARETAQAAEAETRATLESLLAQLGVAAAEGPGHSSSQQIQQGADALAEQSADLSDALERESVAQAAEKSAKAAEELRSGLPADEALEQAAEAVAEALALLEGREDQINALVQEIAQSQREALGLLRQAETRPPGTQPTESSPDTPTDGSSTEPSHWLARQQQRLLSRAARASILTGDKSTADPLKQALSRGGETGEATDLTPSQGNMVAQLSAYVESLQLTRSRLEAALTAGLPLDFLSATEREHAPAAYRELVDAYFEVLTRRESQQREEVEP